MREVQVIGLTKRRKTQGHQYKRVEDIKVQVKRAGSKSSNVGATLRAMLILLLVD